MKTLKITEDTHTKLKIYCAKNKLKINEWVENLIKLNLKKL
jgi:hypothetical protein